MINFDNTSSYTIYKFVGGDFDILEGYAKVIMGFLARVQILAGVWV